MREWVIQESEFRTVANETVYGLHVDPKNNVDGKKNQKTQQRAFFGDTKNPVKCKMCNGPHGIWSCEQFKRLDLAQKWSFVRQTKLCYRCLGSGHYGRSCKRSRPCNIDSCAETHHRLLHIENRNASQSKDRNQSSSSVLNQGAPEFRTLSEYQTVFRS